MVIKLFNEHLEQNNFMGVLYLNFYNKLKFSYMYYPKYYLLIPIFILISVILSQVRNLSSFMNELVEPFKKCWLVRLRTCVSECEHVPRV